MTNREALTESLARLGDLVGLEAEVQAAFTIADEVDSGNGSPELLREYRFWLRMIREALADESTVDAGVTELLSRLGGTPLCNASNTG